MKVFEIFWSWRLRTLIYFHSPRPPSFSRSGCFPAGTKRRLQVGILQVGNFAGRNFAGWGFCRLEFCRLPRVDRYTGYFRYTGICLDTGIGDIDNLKIPIYRHFGILLPNTELKCYFKSNLLTITFRKQS